MRDDRRKAVARLKNWGKWAGREYGDDPALTHYYTVSPMWVGTKYDTRGGPPVDIDSAERAERVMVELMGIKAHQQTFELLRDYYAYNKTLRQLSSQNDTSSSTIFRNLKRAEAVFLAYWQTPWIANRRKIK